MLSQTIEFPLNTLSGAARQKLNYNRTLVFAARHWDKRLFMPNITLAHDDSTSRSLLSGLRNRDPIAWERVSSLYGPHIHYWGKRFGLNNTDTDDLCQTVLVAVIKHSDKFRKENPSHSFRKWLYVIARREAIRMKQSKAALPLAEQSLFQALVEEETQQIDDPSDSETALSELHQRALGLLKASVNAKTWEIFWEATASNLTTEMIAIRFDTTSGNVRVIKMRMLAKLMSILELSDDT